MMEHEGVQGALDRSNLRLQRGDLRAALIAMFNSIVLPAVRIEH